MIKIVFEGSIFLHQKVGGISKYINNLNYGLLNNSIKSKIFSPIVINEDLKKKNSNTIFFLRIKKIPRFFTKFIYFINNFLTIFYIKINKPDLLHFSYYNNSLLNFIDIPYILTVYDLIHEKLKSTQNKFKKSELVENASHIICISHQTKKELIKYYKVKKKKISVIHLGVEQKIYLREKKKNIILFVGSRRGYKNFHSFVKAYGTSKYLVANFRVVCFGDKKFDTAELKLFKDLNIENKIKFVSGNDKKLNNYYKISNLFVTTSFHEGFGLTPLEAMRMSCPVICSNLPVFKETLKNACLYVNPHNQKNIKLKMEHLLKSKKKQKILIKKGYQIVENFKWNNCCYKTAEIYKHVLNER